MLEMLEPMKEKQLNHLCSGEDGIGQPCSGGDRVSQPCSGGDRIDQPCGGGDIIGAVAVIELANRVV